MSRTDKLAKAKANAKKAQAEQQVEKKNKEEYLHFLNQMQVLASRYWHFRAKGTPEAKNKAMAVEVEMEVLAGLAKEKLKLAQSKIGDSVEYVKNCLTQAERGVSKNMPRLSPKATQAQTEKKTGMDILAMIFGCIGIAGTLLFLINFSIDNFFSSSTHHPAGTLHYIMNHVYIFAGAFGLVIWCVNKMMQKVAKLNK
ncbi:MAG: hypothetical protein FWG02_09245 [Holophagaceae bacterium]|nr:hypothetical protein [Holophagaceae bacterium]